MLRRVIVGLLAAACAATLSVACGAADNRRQNSVEQALFSLVGLYVYEEVDADSERARGSPHTGLDAT